MPTFAELSPLAKEKVRQQEIEFLSHYSWWEFTLDDAAKCADCLGIEIHSLTRKSGYNCPDISFSMDGHYSGVTFGGWWRNKPTALTAIREHAPNDEVLHKLAADLITLQVTARLTLRNVLEARINSDSRRGQLTVEVQCAANNDIATPTPEMEEQVLALMRRFAEWIYNQLEQEYEYLASDQAINEHLGDTQFDEAGTLV